MLLQPQRGTASNHYDLLARLAGGGMAEIFLARANGLEGFERYVVLKRIRPERSDDSKFVGMFLDEARLAAQLQHPNIAQVFDLGRIGDDYFYTMEFVHGRDVLDILERQEELDIRTPLAVVLAIISGAAAGLAHAHERRAVDGKLLNIVHRDISPSNLMVSYEGTVKVLDFGIAKARVRQTETQAGTIMGKIAYLSPEQCRSGNIDHRSDIFSLGIVFYELITGERAFKRDADFETLRAVVNDQPPLPTSIVPALPKAVDDIIMRCLAKDPDERYATVTELIDAVEELAENQGISLTAGVLRRHMKDLFGTRPEPWQALETEKSLDGLPLDVDAEDVPLLQATGLLDVEALIARQDMPPTPHRIALGLMHEEDLPTPLRVPTGSVPMVPVESLMPDVLASSPRPLAMPQMQALASMPMPVARGSLEDMPPPVVAVPSMPPTRASLVMPATPVVERKRSPLVVIITAGVVVGASLALFFALSRGDDRGKEPATTPANEVRRVEPTATPIEPIEEPAKTVNEAAPRPGEAKPATESKKSRVASPKPIGPSKAKATTTTGDLKKPKTATPKSDLKKPKASPKPDAKPEPQPEPKPAKPACTSPDPMDCPY